MFQKRHYCALADRPRTDPMAIRELDRRLVAHSLAVWLERDNRCFQRLRPSMPLAHAVRMLPSPFVSL
jgi:hypothetical protein